MAGEPIRLGSAAEPRLIFQDGSSITISDSGIQECSIKALCPDAANVFNYIPPAGATYDSVFGNNYLPSDFKVDRTKNSSVVIEYGKGKSATITLSFKRPDPINRVKKISVTSVFKHINNILTYLASQGAEGLDETQKNFGTAGIPEPVVTVRYNADALPSFGDNTSFGGLGGDRAGWITGGGSQVGGSDVDGQYALPGSAAATGFPTCGEVSYKFKLLTVAGSQPGAQCVEYTTANCIFKPDPHGWQIVEKAAEPVSGESFFDITETWRTFYVFDRFEVISTITAGACA